MRAADLPAPRPSVTLAPIWILRGALDCASDWASVFAMTNSTPSSFDEIMLLTALPPAPPTPRTVIRGFSSVISGALSLIVMTVLLSAFHFVSLNHPTDAPPL